MTPRPGLGLEHSKAHSDLGRSAVHAVHEDEFETVFINCSDVTGNGRGDWDTYIPVTGEPAELLPAVLAWCCTWVRAQGCSVPAAPVALTPRFLSFLLLDSAHGFPGHKDLGVTSK